MPRKPLFTILMLALVTGYALPATAALMTIGNLNYDAAVGPNITDTRSGVEYLNLGAVKSLNYAETLSVTGSGGLYSTYHIASQTEAYVFLTH